jgi:hypothetical protein
MNRHPRWLAAVLLLPLGAVAQAQAPVGSQPVGESRLPTERPAPVTATGIDECNRQAQAIRDQFALQEKNVRREISERSKTAPAGDKDRIRLEGEQRLSALKLEAADAERRVKATCRG